LSTVKGTEWYSSGSLSDFSSDLDESRNWSLGKVGDVSLILHVATQLKARSETELFWRAHAYEHARDYFDCKELRALSNTLRILIYFLEKQVSAV